MTKDPEYVPYAHTGRSINVDGLPEPVALALDSIVRALRRSQSASDVKQLTFAESMQSQRRERKRLN